MKKVIIFTMLVQSFAFCAAQTVFNHTTLYVTDLARSENFYAEVMQLKKISEPFHDGKHTWFALGHGAQLHVVSGAASATPHDINIHLAFSVPSLNEFIAHLKNKNVKFGNWAGNSETPQLRPDGIHQVYLQDPDGYWIEVNDDKSSM
jgi:lactoylglutathione lyase